MKRHTRGHIRYHWLRIGQKRRALYRVIWAGSSDYLDTISLNEHARMSLGKRCSCEMCSSRNPDGWRQRERRDWQRIEGIS